MDLQPLHVEDHQAMSAEQPVERRQREVAEVLVIDGVELDVLDHVADIRSLDNHNSSVFH